MMAPLIVEHSNEPTEGCPPVDFWSTFAERQTIDRMFPAVILRPAQRAQRNQSILAKRVCA